jgi:ABC-2 type transport system permease protein
VSRAVPFGAVVRSEWTKLWSVRATWWCAALYLLVVGGSGWLAAATTDRSARADIAAQTALTGFASGMVLVSLTAVPRRTRLLLAKTVVVTAWCVLLTAVLAVVCALAARTLTVLPGGVQPADPDVLRILGLQVGAAGLVGALSVALGTVLRSTAGAVGVGAALVFVLPPVFALAGGETAARVSQGLPTLRVGEDAFLAVATPWPLGMAIVAAWALGVWVLGAVLLERRDV